MTTSASNANNNKNSANVSAPETAASTATIQPATPATTTATHSGTGSAGGGAMQSDEDFNIRFVNLVRMHKCLYDKKVPEYRNRDNQEKAWSLISQETRESVIHCKERWRNLRACLSRYIKQQSGTDPQHKPYYLTEHMAFLLPFLKSTRNSLDNNSLAALFQISQQQHHQMVSPALATLQVIAQPFGGGGEQSMELKHSISDNEDEETIDAFDPAVTANLQQLQRASHLAAAAAAQSPLSDTASANTNTLQNFIPDVQLAELRTPDAPQDIVIYGGYSGRHDSRDLAHEPKRIKTECHDHSGGGGYSGENADMEFFRSILPDIAALTPQQKRKFKIGILELIDDVIVRYPEHVGGPTSSSSGGNHRRSSARH